MKRGFLLAVLLGASSAGLACTEKGAFGAEFGKPVPANASADAYDYGLGTDGRGCFTATAPAPYKRFGKYGYCANRSDKVVFAVDAYRTIIDPSQMKEENPAWEKAANDARAEILGIKKDWEKKYGLTFKMHGTLGLVWSAETPAVQAVIAVQGAELHVKCVNRALEAKSMSATKP